MRAQPKYEAVIIDYETLGQDPDIAPVISVSITPFSFDHATKKSMSQIVNSNPQFFAKFQVASQVTDHGRKVHSETLKWWGRQSEEARKKSLYPSPIDESVGPAHIRASEFIKQHCIPSPIIFCRGQSFDIPILACIIRDYEINDCTWFKFWNHRDSRSYIAGSLANPKEVNGPLPIGTYKDFIHHDPVWDNAKEILQIQYCTWYNSGEEEIPDHYEIMQSSGQIKVV